MSGMRIGLGMALGLSLATAPSLLAADDIMFAVTSVSDEADARPGDRLCATSKGECSLRAALAEANALQAPVRIELRPGRYEVGSTLTITAPISLRGTQPSEVSVVARPNFEGARLISFGGDEKETWRDLADFTLDAGRQAGVIETIGGVPLRLTRMVVSGGAIGTIGGDGGTERMGGGGGRDPGTPGGAGVAATGPLVMIRCSLIDNRIGESAGRGGALFVESGPAWVTQSTLTGNLGRNSGGIFARNAAVTLDFVSVVGNSGRPVGGYQQNPMSTLHIRGSWIGESLGERNFDCRSTAEGGAVVSGGDNLLGVTGPTGQRIVDDVWRDSWEFFCRLAGPNDRMGSSATPLTGAWQRVTSSTGLVGVVLAENHPGFRMVRPERCLPADAWGRAPPAGEPCDVGALLARHEDRSPPASQVHQTGGSNRPWIVGGLLMAAAVAALFFRRVLRRG